MLYLLKSQTSVCKLADGQLRNTAIRYMYCLPLQDRGIYIKAMYKLNKWIWITYVGLPKISQNLNKPRKPLAIPTCAARCVLLYLSTNSRPTGVFLSARVSEFWLFTLHRFHVCLRLSKWRMPRSEGFALNCASSSTKLQLKPIEC